MTPEQVAAIVAKAKAEAQARAAEQAYIANVANAQAAAVAAGGTGATGTGAGARGGAGVASTTGGPVSAATLLDKKAALQAKLAAMRKATAKTAAISPAAPVDTDRPRGGLGMDASSLISRDAEGNLIINPVKLNKPSFATAKVNQKPEPKKGLPILDVPEDFTDTFKNPYYDPNVGSAAPRARVARPFKLAPKGKFHSIANNLRAEEKLAQFVKEIEAGGQAKVAEEDLVLKDSFTKRSILQDGCEWWDAPLLPNKTYDDLPNGKSTVDTPDSLITHYVQHPIQIQPPNDQSQNTKPRALMLTTKERKKLRRQNRRELLKEKQDKIRLGLLPPDEPKVKLSNMMRVFGQEAVLNPTEVEMKVRQQVQERLETHLKSNEERKLTHEERKAKEEKKKEEDLAKGIHVCVYRVNDLSHPQKKYKVDMNAQQLGLTGLVVMHPLLTMVIVEGGHKAVRQYKKLMLRRIDWTDNTRLDGTEVMESTTENKCLLVWEGQIKVRQFKQFRFSKCRTDAALKETLNRTKAQNYWDLAMGFKEDDMVGAEAVI